jgi:uncharacterized protein
LDTYSSEEKFILQKLKDELSPKLTYHGLHHTYDVLNAAMKIAEEENVSKEELKLLRIAILFHDSGFIKTYKNHEESGCQMAREYLPDFGYTKKELDIICDLIMTTKIPQSAITNLEKIICDADLDYLGRSDFPEISESLFEEMKTLAHLQDRAEWNAIQKKFLEKHQYYTDFSKQKREPKKQEHLKKVRQSLSHRE